MKRAICAVLAACSVAMAGEPQSPSANPPAAEPSSPASKVPLPPGWTLRPDGKAQGPQGQVVPIQLDYLPVPTACYFIRTQRPISYDEIREASKPQPGEWRLVPLQAQARIAGIVTLPTCAQGGRAIHADDGVRKDPAPNPTPSSTGSPSR